jgi:CRP/FNR family transcriptional regulator, cyclic AMP receptor protein
MLLSVNRTPILGTDVLRERPLPPGLSRAPKTWPKTPSTEPAAKANGNPKFSALPRFADLLVRPLDDVAVGNESDEADFLYLFACFAKWEQEEEPSAAWELLAAVQNSHADTRAHARALLASSRHFPMKTTSSSARRAITAADASSAEADMNFPYGLEIAQKCSECTAAADGFFCKFSEPLRKALDEATHKSTLPPGAVLFVEGQSPRGMFVVCSGRVNLSTTSREGKLLLLKTAEAGEVVGLSATLCGLGYEVTAETATPCQVSFIDRNHVLGLMREHTEFSLQSADFLSRGFHEAYRDIRDLMLSKTSAGKLARLLLSQSFSPDLGLRETRIPSTMTHEEMAHRIGASRETVTRLLTALKKKHLIRQDGSTLVIRDRTALEALTV